MAKNMAKKSLFENLFTFNVDIDQQTQEVKAKAKKFFEEEYDALVKDCDRIFVALMLFQWVASVVLALSYTPKAYSGTTSAIHYHVWLALFGGGLLALTPLALYISKPGHVINRYINVISQGLFSALLIHLSGGRLETHFHVFGSLAFFAFYRDIRVLLVGTAVVAVDHLVRGVWFPVSVFGIGETAEWRWLEHAGWVLFEDFFLAYACFRSLYEMKVVAVKRAEVEVQKEAVEGIVTERTAELSAERNSMKLILDNIDQALFTVNRQGKVIGEASAKATEIFGSQFSQASVDNIFKDEAQGFKDVLEIIYDESLPFDSCAPLLPAQITFNDRTINVSYKPVIISDKITSLLVIATDVTEFVLMQNTSKATEEKNRALVKILSSKNDFIECIDMAKQLSQAQSIEHLKRQLHTLKGALAFLECREMAEACHSFENEVGESSEGVEVLREKADEKVTRTLLKFVKDNNQILKLGSDNQMIEIEINSLGSVLNKVKKIDPSRLAVAELEELLKVSVKEELGWLSDAFVHTAEKLGKSVEAIDFKGNTRVPTRVYKSLFKSFIHLVRNSVDHGIEDSATREMLGKSPNGHLSIELSDMGDKYQICFKDDGAGVDTDKLRAKLNLQLNDEDILQKIFEIGTSTKDQVTETSGRGVGLDSVKHEAERLGGQVIAINHPGEGLEIRVTFKKISFAENLEAKSLAA